MIRYRIGEGYDVHRLVVGRPLIVGGVKIPYERGLDGHSDADVLLHAICDALLGAAALGDIGAHFPDDSSVYKNISSLKLLLVIPVIVLFIAAISACEKSINPDKSTDVKISLPESPVNQIIEVDKGIAYKNPEIAVTVTPPPPPPPPPVIEQSKTTSTEKLDENIPNKIDPVNEEIPDQVFVVVEEMPKFPGGDKAMMDFIYANIVYPETAKENNIQGRVILKFCVTYKGTVDKVTVLKGVDPDLDNEAVRVIKMLPTWKPGKQGGKPVNVWYNVPVTFQLK